MLITTCTHTFPVGDMILASCDDRLCLCDFIIPGREPGIFRKLHHTPCTTFASGTTPVTELAINQLNEYFCRQRTAFTVPLTLFGTPFQQQVWRTLQQIGYGQTVSYATEAAMMNRPKAFRAVANANGANPISIIIPCHRVIASGGKIGGYGGGLHIKRFLLNLENPDLTLTP